MTEQWYALRSKPHKERLLHKQVSLRGFDVFYPRIRVKPVNPRARRVKPYFPGYMFVHVDLDLVGKSAFRWMPYAIGLVCFDGNPSPIPNVIISALKKHVREIDLFEIDRGSTFQKGEEVIILAGPLEGYQGIFDRLRPGTERVRILLEMLSGQHLRIELDVNTIKHLEAKH